MAASVAARLASAEGAAMRVAKTSRQCVDAVPKQVA